MRVVVPFDTTEPKTRLSAVLSAEERRDFAGVMLGDVLDSVREAGGEPAVLATEPIDIAPSVPVNVDDRSLTAAVNGVLRTADHPVAIVMADLALATSRALSRLFSRSGDVVIAPGRGGGTNALVVRHPEFRVDYHGASCRDHLTAARRVSASVGEVDSHRLATDVDDPDDLVEVLLHGEGRAAAWLRDAGFEVATPEGRAIARREGNR